MTTDKPSLGNTTELGSQAEFAAKYSYTALRFYLLAVARAILPNHRLQICWKYPLPARETIDVIYSEERQRARAVGTMKCASPWVCPVCSLYIAERRRQELGAALEACRGEYVAVMITYTVQHDQGMKLAPLLGKMQKAFRFAKTGRAWQEIKKEFYLIGSIRAIEITYGASGWHPHYHELAIVDIQGIQEFYEGAIDEYTEGLQEVMVRRWLAGLEKQGLTAAVDIGLKITATDDEVKDYITKYGKMPLETDFEAQSDEITRGMGKTARRGNFGAWDILYDAPVSGKMKDLFLEYAAATKGRSQLQWSRGLKALLKIDEIRDAMACEGIETETDRLLAAIPLPLWRYIAARDYLGQLMTYAHTGDTDKVSRLIARLNQKFEADQAPSVQFDVGH